MKILFICGSLEPGKDGVGDYTHRLSLYLKQLGHEILLVSIHDRHLPTPHTAQFNPSSELHRFSPALTWAQRTTLLKTILDFHSPDWVSIQFVPFSFHPKGLCYSWLWLQNQISQKYPVHIMFHETWVGWDMPERLTTRILGFLQLCLFTLFDFAGSVTCVSTQLPLHQKRLRPHRLRAQLLPLFSNIAVSPTDHAATRNHLISTHYPDAPPNLRIAAFFGNLQGSLDPLIFKDWTRAHAAEPWLILAVGQHNAVSQRRWAELTRTCYPNHKYAILGPLADQELSHCLQAMNLGFTAYPNELVGKSGASAAMWEHGLEIISVGRFNHHQTHTPRRLHCPVPAGKSVTTHVTHALLKLLRETDITRQITII